MWVVLLIAGCEVSKVWVTGGGEVTVTLAGDGIDDAFVVRGLSEQELDELFVDGHSIGEVLGDLYVRRFDPGFAASWHVQYGSDGEVQVELVDNDVVGFEPCGTPIRHVEFFFFFDPSSPSQLQFDGRGPADPSIPINSTPPPTLVEPMGAPRLSFDPEMMGLVGTHDTPVIVRCGSSWTDATLSVHWEFDGDVQRRWVHHGWKGNSSSGPIGPAQL